MNKKTEAEDNRPVHGIETGMGVHRFWGAAMNCGTPALHGLGTSLYPSFQERYPQYSGIPADFAPDAEALEKQTALDKRYLRMAKIWSENSYAVRRQVGCLVVKDRMIISDGYNGTPTGFPNVCEDENNVTLPYVLHAEANAITKLAKSGNSADGATLYCTDMPCMECSKLIIQAGIKRVVYARDYHHTDGVKLLRQAGVIVDCLKEEGGRVKGF